jgi:hypothetical protein
MRYVQDVAALEAALAEKLSTNEGVEDFLNKLLGKDAWTYDKEQDVWVFSDGRYKGHGRRFFVMKRGGSYFCSVLPDAST